ncbi:hypothetical protein [uncultured Bradyrhizobium sp.]|uniref:hypothetical protein n=1 Tax=uncultured Bradyrhizobium sp. TaxID=199684 RepID=UPI0035CC101E
MTIKSRQMSAPDMTRTFNEWMRRYIEEPEKYTREFQRVRDFLADEAAGREPSYGESCTAYQFEIFDEMNATPIAD